MMIVMVLIALGMGQRVHTSDTALPLRSQALIPGHHLARCS